MEKVEIDKDKVVISIPANTAKDLQTAVAKCVEDWKGYFAPKLNAITVDKLELEISSVLCKKVSEKLEKGQCKCCGKALESSSFGLLPQLLLKEERMLFVAMCDKCFKMAANAFGCIGGGGKVLALWKKRERSLTKLKGGIQNVE